MGEKVKVERIDNSFKDDGKPDRFLFRATKTVDHTYCINCPAQRLDACSGFDSRGRAGIKWPQTYQEIDWWRLRRSRRSIQCTVDQGVAPAWSSELTQVGERGKDKPVEPKRRDLKETIGKHKKKWWKIF